MVTTKEARQTLAGLVEKLADSDRRAIELENEATGISLAAMTGDASARKRLDQLNRERAAHELEGRNIKSAIRAQEAVVAEAERAEAMAGARENAEAAMIIGDRLVERAAKIDAALATARDELQAYKRDIDSLHLTGCAAPTGQQWLVFGGLAVTAFTMQLPVTINRDFLAPRERRTFMELSKGWRDGVARWAAPFVGDKSEAA